MKTRQQIADEYGVSTKTLNNWLILHDIILPKCGVTPKYQKLIYEALGYPPCVEKANYEEI